MDLTTIALSSVSYLIGSFSEGEGVKKAKDDFTNALWDWVKPIFIKDDTPLKDLEANSDSKLNQSEVSLKIEKFLSNNSQEIPIIIKILKDLNAENKPKITLNIEQFHYGSGDNIARDKIINKE